MKQLTRSSAFGIFLLLAGAGREARASLLSFYAFDETSGTTAFDSAGSVNGNLQGGAVFAPGAGISGGAISLDKLTDSMVDMGNNFNFTGDFSIQAWVKISSGDTSYETPVARHFAGVTTGYFLGINDVGDGCSASNKVHLYAEYPCSGTSAISVNDGQWHQLVGTVQGGVRSIYVDGVCQSSAAGPNPLSAAANFRVGGISDTGGNPDGTFTGLVDQVGVWNNALSASEVQGLFDNPTGIPEPSPLALLSTGAVFLFAFRRRSGRV